MINYKVAPVGLINWSDSVMVTLLSALSNVLKTSVEQMDRILQNKSDF